MGSSPSVPLQSKYRWPVVGLLWIAFLINYLDRQVVFSIFPVLARDLHFSNTQLGLTGTVFTWVYCVSMPLAGRLADLMPRARLVVVSIMLWSVATLATGLSGSVTTFLLTRAATGITEALFMPAALGLIASLHSGSTRSRALAIFATGQFAGIALGGWYGGWAADHTGWRAGFYSLALAGLLYSSVLWFLLQGAAESQDRVRPPSHRPLDILRSRCWLALATAFSAFCAMLWIMLVWLASFIHDRFGVSLTESGLTATAFLQIGSAAGTLTGGFLGDAGARRFAGGRFLAGAVGLLAAAPFGWVVFSAKTLFTAELCSAGLGLFGGLFIANLYAGAYDVISERNWGVAAGTLNLVGGFAGGSGVLLTGVMKESLGIAFAMRCAAVAAVASSIVMAYVVAKRYRLERSNAAGACPINGT
jgi:predicted MFS family arabinose efflux permease